MASEDKPAPKKKSTRRSTAAKRKSAPRKHAVKQSAAAKTPPIEEVVAVPEPPAAPSTLLAGSKVREKDVTTFMRELIMLLEAGTPILKSLKTLSERGRRPGIRGLISDIAQYVEAGNPLWQAFQRHPRHFKAVDVNLIKASEASGQLIPVLERLAEYRERREMKSGGIR